MRLGMAPPAPATDRRPSIILMGGSLSSRLVAGALGRNIAISAGGAAARGLRALHRAGSRGRYGGSEAGFARVGSRWGRVKAAAGGAASWGRRSKGEADFLLRSVDVHRVEAGVHRELNRANKNRFQSRVPWIYRGVHSGAGSGGLWPAAGNGIRGPAVAWRRSGGGLGAGLGGCGGGSGAGRRGGGAGVGGGRRG